MKRSKDSLKRSAAVVMAAKDRRDERYLRLIITLSMATGLNAKTIEGKLAALAKV